MPNNLPHTTGTRYKDLKQLVKKDRELLKETFDYLSNYGPPEGISGSELRYYNDLMKTLKEYIAKNSK